MRFEILARDGAARRGRLTSARGVIETPAFMPVGTLGAVKGLTPQELEQSGAQVMLANLYHLSLRPGIETIVRAGGLHRFTGWNRSMLTDSGGFQVFSLAALRKVDDKGVRFRSHLDGSLLELTPESVVAAQEAIGVDFAMVLDECPPWPVTEEVAAAALARTLRWAERSIAARTNDATALFGIVQGSSFRHLREASAAALSALPFDGYAIGGVSVGEPIEPRRAAIEWTTPCLPDSQVRYLMGVGTISDMVHAISHGVDLFDCVLPARNGRHGLLFTRQGAIRIKNARFRDDAGPLDPECSCPVCARLSRAFLHHLFRSGELSAAVYGTIHNLRVFLDFMGEAREAIAAFRVADLARRWVSRSADEHRSETSAAVASLEPHLRP
ncbi:MAG: tRNA guanosine(34) transglycosylase Tgt [Thermoanaerobaculia bacterium]